MGSRNSNAEQNRARILDAARGSLARGDALTLNSVAHAAGVGVATVYRHFPSVEALEETLVWERFRELQASMAQVEGPAEFDGVLERYYELMVSDPLFAIVTSRSDPALHQTTLLREELIGRLDELMQAQVAAGALTSGLTSAELLSLLCGLAYSARTLRVTAVSPSGRRLFAVMRAGMRPAG